MFLDSMLLMIYPTVFYQLFILHVYLSLLFFTEGIGQLQVLTIVELLALC